MYELGQVASDWKFESFKHLRFGEATYSFLVHALSAELRLQKQPIHGWPSLNKACEKSEPGVAFYDYIVERIRFEELLLARRARGLAALIKARYTCNEF